MIYIRDIPKREDLHKNSPSAETQGVIRTILGQYKESGCLICGAPTKDMGVFVPDDDNFDFGKHDGDKTRLVIYHLCGKHRWDDEKINAALKREWQ